MQRDRLWPIWLFYAYIISLSISPAVFTDPNDNRNYLLIFCMGIGFFGYLLMGKIQPRKDSTLLLIMILTIFIQGLFHFHSTRWSSIFFTCMFFFYYMVGLRLAKKCGATYESLYRICRGIIVAYFLVLLLQQICVLFGFPVINSTRDMSMMSSQWKLNSLSSEPSHTGRFVGILMYSCINAQFRIVKRSLTLKESYKLDRKLWLTFLWIELTTISGTAMIILAIIMTIFLSKRNIILFISIIGVIFCVGLISNITALRRATTFLLAVAGGNPELMMVADHSASTRIVPVLLCIFRLNPLSLGSWIGEGSGTIGKWLSQYMPGVPEGYIGGGIAAYAVECGLLVASLFISFSYRCCYDSKHKIPSIGLWIMCVLLIGINSQIGWLCMTMLYLDKNLDKLVSKTNDIGQSKKLPCIVI